MVESKEYIVDASEIDGGLSRLDVYLSKKNEELSRSYIQKLITDGAILVNKKPVKPGFSVRPGDHIKMEIPEPEQVELKPEPLELDIYYEDEDILVVNKKKGMVVHPAAGNYEGTLVNALLHYCNDLSGINGELRPGIVHRIDKDTSGLLAVAKHDRAHRGFAAQLKSHTMKRIYTALVVGNVKEHEGIIEAPIGRHTKNRKKMAVTNSGKEAVTSYKVLERFGSYTLLELRLKTGRTHQIRVHMSYIGYPVAGDPKYGSKQDNLGLEGQALHAGTLGFSHPVKGNYMEFSAPVPPYFQEVLQKIAAEKVTP